MWAFETERYKAIKRQIDTYERVQAGCNAELALKPTRARRVFLNRTLEVAQNEVARLKIELTTYERAYRNSQPAYSKEDVRAASIAKSQKKDRW